MAQETQLLPTRERSHFVLQGRLLPFLTFATVMLFIFMADAIMSFTAPVFIENIVGSTFYMGLILSTSSMFGFICDLLFAQIFKGKSYVFFTLLLIALATTFPLSFIFLPPTIATFLFAMASWGVYFELFHFANFSFVHAFSKPEEHGTAWGILESFRSIAYLLGPLFAGYLMDKHVQLPFYGALAGLTTGLMVFGAFLLRYRRNNHHVTQEKPMHRSFWTELKTWKLLFAKIWPLFMISTIIVMLDSAFWSVGAVISEEMRQTSIAGSLLLPAYTVPALFMPLLAGMLGKPLGKKRTAFLMCLPIGPLMLLATFSNDNWILLGTTFMASMFLSVAFTELYAVYEDYVSRLESFGSDMIGLQGATGSIGYIIGPIAAGSVATLVGNRNTFAVFGMLLSLAAIIAWIAMPRKTRLPQTELKELNS